MRMKIAFILILTAFFALNAKEGMIPLDGVTPAIAADMKAMGCRFDPAGIWRPGQECMAMAVVNLGATGSFVSADGLIITNHHVAFGAVQSLSSPEHNYIRDGFLAAGREQEVPAPGYSVRVMTGFANVTPRFRTAMRPGLGGEKRQRLVEKISKELVAAGEKAPGSECVVARFYGGREFYLVTYFKIRDMRVVYVPARSIGEYGGEVDNWMWPRHTCDFSFLRAYVSKDGLGAEFSPENLPYKPKSIVKISLEGLKDGDFTFVMGYPGRTSRNYTLSEVKFDKEGLGRRIAQFKEIIDFFEKAGQGKRDVEIKYAGLVKGLYNSLKNMQGKLEGMDKIDLFGKKKSYEEDFLAWAAQDPARQKRYGDILSRIDLYMSKLGAYTWKNNYLTGLTGMTGSSLLSQAYLITRTVEQRQKPDAEREPQFQDRNLPYIKQSIQLAERGYDLPTDRAFLKHNLEKILGMPDSQVPSALKELAGKKSEKVIEEYVDGLYDKTLLTGPDKRLELIGLKPAQLAKLGDPLISLAAGLETELKVLREDGKALGQERSELKKVFEAALLERSGGAFAPDANGTIRFTYGPVKGYNPRDAVFYLPQTTLKGVIEKDTGSFPFHVPDKIKTLFKARDFGRYLDSGLGEVACCFLNTTNVTGGNSGSPTLNARGEQVGIIFDMTYESVIGDYYIVPELQRSISVDIRYVLFVTEKFSSARNVIQELGI
jgi:hypothetical protein